MDPPNEILISSFVNVHLFWIILRKDILLRNAMHKLMNSNPQKVITYSEDILNQELVCVNVDGIWTRAILKQVLGKSNEIEAKYICWLPDFGILMKVQQIYDLPKCLQRCPFLAKQASLYQVVNLTTDLVLGQSGYEIKLKKTINDIQGVKQVALDYIEAAKKLYFSVQAEDNTTLYGDIICLLSDDSKISLTDTLISEDLLAQDDDMFSFIEDKRKMTKEIFFNHSQNWKRSLSDQIEQQNLKKIIFNRTRESTMEFFERYSLS